MASGKGRRQVVSAMMTHKQESLQYLTVDSATYLHWRTLARGLDLTTDCDLAAFLLQHYEKTSEILPLTQCIKCCGPLLQYCMQCNIYITQSTTSSTLLEQEGASCDDAVMPGETILIDIPDMNSASSVSESQQLVLVKTDDMTDMDISEGRGETVSSNQLEALVEACALQGAIVTGTSKPHLEPHTTISTTKSLLTPETLQRLKSQSAVMNIDTEPKIESLPVVDSLVTTADYQLLTTTQPVTTSQLTTPCGLASESQPMTEMGWSSDAQVSAVVGGECAGEGQLPAEAPSIADSVPEPSQETAAQILTTIGAHSEDLSSCFQVLPKSDLSDDESEYFCEPLFKPEKAEDKDLEAAISALDDKVSIKSHPSTSVSDGACIKVTQCGTHDLSVSQSAGTDLETGNATDPDTAEQDLETSESAGPPDLETKDSANFLQTSASPGFEMFDPVNPCLETSDSAKASLETSDSANARLEMSDSANAGLEASDSANAGLEASDSAKPDSCPPALSDVQMDLPASPERQGKSAGRKRKVELGTPDSTSSPSASPQKRKMLQVVSHTMRTRFFDKKRPSILPSSADSSFEIDLPGSSKRGQNSGRGRRGRRPGSGRRKETLERDKKKRVSEKSTEEELSEDEDVLDSHEHEEILDSSLNEQSIDNKGKEMTANSTGKQNNGDSRKEDSTSLTEEQKNQDLQNQIIVITSEEDLEKVTLPKNRLLSQPSLQGITIKTEPSAPVVKIETNINPLVKIEPGESKLSSKVSIVTDADDGSDLIPRKKRRLQSKKVVKTYVCDMCEEVMDSRSELKKHVNVQHGNRPYACNKCSATYKCRSHLRVHLNRHVEVKPFQCHHCDKTFASNYARTAHLTVHSTERPEVCDICGLTFKSPKYLKGHMRTHDPSDKPFICQQCGTRFSRKSNLNNHLKIHNNDKQFVCRHCDRRFIQSGSLKSHLFRMHNPNRARPYVCEICGQARYAKDQFQKHMMIHTGTKPFKCEVCGAAFVQSNALKGHMRIHTEMEGKTHFCNLCHAAFKKFASLKKHLRLVHHDYSEVPITYEIIEVQI